MAVDIMRALEMTPPEPDFIWPGLLAGTVGALIAPGATGKSFWALEAAMAVACSVPGGDILGLAPAATGRVVYLAAEDPEPALIRRVHAMGPHLARAAWQEIADNLTLEPVMGRRVDVMNSHHQARIVEFCADARLVILDTLSRVHGLDENDNGAMARLIAQLEFIAASTGSTILYLHHVSKASARQTSTDQQAARGASALIDNARWAGYLAPMSEAESTFWSDRTYDRAPIGDGRWQFVRYGVSKQNHDQHVHDQWYKRGAGGVLLPVELLVAVDDETKTAKGRRRHVL